MEYKAHSSENKAELILDADSTIGNSPSLHAALLEARETAGEVVINMSEVRHIDVSCLQLLCSAHHEALKQGRILKLAHISAETWEAMKLLGFVRHIGCRDDSSGGCLWVGRENG